MSERRRPVTVLRDRAAAESVERMVGEVNESLGALGITEEIQLLSRARPDGSVRVAMSHTMPEISALQVVASAVIRGRAGAWSDDGGLTASGAAQMSREDQAALWRAEKVVERLMARHEVWRSSVAGGIPPAELLRIRRSDRARRRSDN